MRQSLTLSLILATATLTPLAAAAQVAKVNGVAIPQARADLMMREATAQGRPDSPELRDAVKQGLIEREAIAQEALKLGLNKEASVAAQLDMARQNVLVGAYVNEMMRRNVPNETSLKAAYEKLKNHPAASEYKAAHILLATEKDALDVIAQIKGGANFDKIAAEKSKDEGSKSQGGDLGWSAPGKFVPPFATAMVKLKKGELTEQPVQSNFGWHIIRLNDLRPISFDALKPQVQQLVQHENVQKMISDLRAKAKVE